MSIETLITIHDSDLIRSCEAEQRFAQAEPYRYLFVGPRAANGDVIVSRDYPGNIEHWPQYYDFTGWFTATRHNLISSDRVLCLQYDHRVNAPIMPIVNGFLDHHPMAAFVAGHRHAQNFMLMIGGFEDAYRAGLKHIDAPPMEDWPDFNEWPSTQGTAWRTEALCEFMQWVEPLFEFWADQTFAGHLMERAVKAWLVTTEQTEAYLPALVTHEGRDCHGTCALMRGDSATYHERAATFGKS